MATQPNRYEQIIEAIFQELYTPGTTEVVFQRKKITEVATKLGIPSPSNLGDLVYSFRYRNDLPQLIQECAPEGFEWIIYPAGKAVYQFKLVPELKLQPNPEIPETKIPDATPGIITKYAFTDEQALLAKVRYNRLVDIFTGVTCYSLQNHLRTSVKGIGQIETDEVYIGLNSEGSHYVFPVQAKGRNDRLGRVQIMQDFALCQEKFSQLICVPIAAQFTTDSLIALFSFEQNEEDEVLISSEKHYRLVSPENIDAQDLNIYRSRNRF